MNNRQSSRLTDYNYSSPGIYFVTICTQNRQCLFGNILNGKMILNKIGTIIKNQWLSMPIRFSNICLDEFIIMPNHIHGIITVGATLAVARNNAVARSTNKNVTLGQIIGTFKSLSVKHCLQWIKNEHKNITLRKLWQRNYYEHIIRNEIELNNIRQYIQDNPKKWQFDNNFKS